MMTKKIIVLFVVISCLGLKASNKDSKPLINVSYSIGINYVTHLYTLAGIGFSDKEYCTLYDTTVPDKDIITLKRYSDYLKFGNGASAPLSEFLFFLPAYANLDSKIAFEQYSQDVNSSITNKDYNPIDKYVPNNKKNQMKQWFLLSDDEEWKNVLSVCPVFNELSRVYIDNIENYISSVYPKIMPDLEARSKHLNHLIQDNNVICDWESVTGYEWHNGEKTYLLFRAGIHGPSFNNLSENINTLYYNLDDAYTVDMLSHEFGIFLLSDSVMPLVNKMAALYPSYENETTVGRVDWMAFEMLAIYYNCKINKRKTEDYYSFSNSDPIAFMEIFEQLGNMNITDPKDLYQKAIAEYMKSDNGYWNNGVLDRYKQLKSEKK